MVKPMENVPLYSGLARLKLMMKGGRLAVVDPTLSRT